MIKQVYEVDGNGFLLNIHVAEVQDGIILDPDKRDMVTVDYPSGFLKYKWDGHKWIEGATQWELDEWVAQKTIEEMKPSKEEVQDAELEIKMITILMELELI